MFYKVKSNEKNKDPKAFIFLTYKQMLVNELKMNIFMIVIFIFILRFFTLRLGLGLGLGLGL